MRISDWSSDVFFSDLRAEDDVGKHREAVQDERERADVEDLLEEAADHIVVAAHRPEESGERDVDADQRHGQEVDAAAEKNETSVHVGDEIQHEAEKNIETVQARTRVVEVKKVAFLD